MATVRIRLRRDTAADWVSNNPVLALGEMGIETDTRKFKFGDGVVVNGVLTGTAWADLSYASGSGGDVATDAIWDAKGDLAVGTGANTAARLAVGSNSQVLTAASGEATGLKWAAASGGQPVTTQTLTDGENIAWDVSAGAHAIVTLGGNRAMSNPSNLVAGTTYTLRVKQDATGSRTLTWGGDYLWPGNVTPTLTSTGAAVDVFVFLSDGTDLHCVGATFDVK